MKYYTIIKKIFCLICILNSLIFICTYVNASALLDEYYESSLKSRDYKTETIEQIVEATKDEMYPIRYSALYLLTNRFDKAAIPILKESLNDPQMEVRWRAAHFLGTLNDKSGLTQMQKDYEKYAYKMIEHSINDSNSVLSKDEKFQQKSYIIVNTGYALNAALVMAELGDLSGYELAHEMSVSGETTKIRMDAVKVLAEMAKKDKEKLIEQKKQPEAILELLLESEKDPDYFIFLTSTIRNIGNDVSVRLLEKAINSPFIKDEKALNIAKSYLKESKEKMNHLND